MSSRHSVRLLIAAIIASNCAGGTPFEDGTPPVPPRTPTAGATVLPSGSDDATASRTGSITGTESIHPSLSGAATHDGVSLRVAMRPATIDSNRPVHVSVEVANDADRRLLLDRSCGLTVGAGLHTSGGTGRRRMWDGRLGRFERLARETPLRVIAHRAPDSGDCTGVGRAIRLRPGHVHRETVVLDRRPADFVPVGLDGILTMSVSVVLVDRPQPLEEREPGEVLRAAVETRPAHALTLSGDLSPDFAVHSLLADPVVASLIEGSDPAGWKLDRAVFVPEGSRPTVHYSFTLEAGGSHLFRRVVYGGTGRVVDREAQLTFDRP